MAIATNHRVRHTISSLSARPWHSERRMGDMIQSAVRG